ncbi:hypothetical protein NDU88_007734 [Pleurodeles waltl]|uniref:Uncharacterized protein n=1 Tax=Pleurodeles waltl TaxID=8319 RepID=A0AAV7PSA1_PLEWA|nr:hypothetical protein NDU88_007734 [Pleurodeles waltl]
MKLQMPWRSLVSRTLVTRHFGTHEVMDFSKAAAAAGLRGRSGSPHSRGDHGFSFRRHRGTGQWRQSGCHRSRFTWFFLVFHQYLRSRTEGLD